MRFCNFCPSNSDGDKLLLKLKPSMLESLRIRSDVDYYACEEHFEIDAYSKGKRRRWTENAELNVGISDIMIDDKVKIGMTNDHPYAKEAHLEAEDDLYEAVDLNMGKDFFVDMQSLACKEETVTHPDQDEEMEEESSCSQVSF